ncbi:MAG TPA: pyrroloquinoline quinone-dependent dehydrogenase [Terriglobales bacterium]|nr:pyrroloquinoline quinone-dependent dehydrogenase [Terriglobales bacterium]
MRLAFFIAFAATALAAQSAGWPAYGGTNAGARFSSARQITASNVGQLKVAWTFHTGMWERLPTGVVNAVKQKAAFEATPVLDHGTLYLTDPIDEVFALDAATGAERWRFSPHLGVLDYSEISSRGVALWGAPRPSVACSQRVLVGTLDARLIALDAATGKPCAGFGHNGEVDLTQGVGLRDPGNYQITSAPTVIGDRVVVGSSIGDNRAVSLEQGVVRAYDVRTGKLAWTWDPIPWAEHQKTRTGAANAWSTIAADAEHDMVYVPTGSASPDYYGGERPGNDADADSVVALRASDGHKVWAFQLTHHDLWDYDVAAEPVLFTWKDGTPAIAVTNKTGNVFVLNRLTGKPLVAVTERAVPQSDVPGEQTSATQPFSALPSLVPQVAPNPEAVFGATAADRAWCTAQIRSARSEGIYTPPSLRGSITVPGNIGGVNWGSAAYDPTRHLFIADVNNLLPYARLIPRADFAQERAAAPGDNVPNRTSGEFAPQAQTPYGLYRTFLMAPDAAAHLPCNQPPWGSVVALDVFSGKIAWSVPLGTFIAGQHTGTPNLGGPIATAGGLVFTAAAMDGKFRAFDSATGKLAWEVALPAGGQATPMTYEINGRQFVVICAGGHGKLGTKLGDSAVAYTLP